MCVMELTSNIQLDKKKKKYEWLLGKFFYSYFKSIIRIVLHIEVNTAWLINFT